ncbi:MAG: UPF0147 family protein [Candidatus Woesearchaeota archaeon]
MKQPDSLKEDDIKEAVEKLGEIKEDTTVPKNVKLKVEEATQILHSNEEKSIRISKALSELEEISNDTNMQAYTRMQILTVISLLEKN